ncbi:AIM24 family protein [Maricaulis sp. CAU 1757]
MARAHEIDYRIVGNDAQFVEIELDPGESVVSTTGAMMYKSPAVEMAAIMGDGSQEKQGFMGALAGAGKRLISGVGLFMSSYTHTGTGKAQVAFAAPNIGTLLAVHLPDIGGELICQRDSFMVAARGVTIDIAVQKRIMTGLFGGEGFVMQRLKGDGWTFIHAGGTLVERELGEGEELHIDTGCLVAYTPGVDVAIEKAGNLGTMLVGGEGLFLAKARGPGKVWLQSLPFARLVGRIQATLPKRTAGGDD